MKLKVKYRPRATITVTRSGLWRKKVVYVILANKALKWGKGRSRLVYVGTTRKGSTRPASSAARKAREALKIRGVNTAFVHILTSEKRPGVKTWGELESALLAVFKSIYGKPPRFNKKIGKYRRPDDIRLFSRQRLRSILMKFEESLKAQL